MLITLQCSIFFFFFGSSYAFFASAIPYRIAFAFKKSLRIFCFWALLRAEVVFAKGVNDRLGVTAWDFSPINQGLLPYLSVEDVLFRGYDSIGWIIYTYSTLTAAHDILAVIFVSLLRWCVSFPLFPSTFFFVWILTKNKK